LDASDPDDATGWYTDEQLEKFSQDAVEVTSVGYVKSSTKLYITLVADFIPNGDGTFTWGRPTKIPHAMVIKIEDLA
jgi:hypothetical protein